MLRRLSPSPVLGVQRFATAEEFRPHEVVGGGKSVPLDPKNTSAVRAILPLSDSLLVLQQSFARRVETEMGADYGLGMVIPLSLEGTINGHTFDNSNIAVTRGKTPSIAVEQRPNIYLMLRFNSDLRSRGWADFEAGIKPVTATSAQMLPLQEMILQMFHFAANANSLDEYRDSMQDALVSALDPILAAKNAIEQRPVLFEKYRKLVVDLDELVQTNPALRLTGEQLASGLHVSLRTLHSAVTAVHGMSIRRYLANKRLWSVRRKLTSGGSNVSVTTAARAAGFWHMGLFAQTYKIQFGELPSETLERARYTSVRCRSGIH